MVHGEICQYPAELVLRFLVVHFNANEELNLDADVLHLLLAIPGRAVSQIFNTKSRGSEFLRCVIDLPWRYGNLSGDRLLKKLKVQEMAGATNRSASRASNVWGELRHG